MIPDQYLAQNTAKKTKKKIITWAGACEVHETFTAADIAELRARLPDGQDHRPPRMPARSDRGGRLFRLDRRA